MKDKLKGFGGMGACPHVSEAKLHPNEGVRTSPVPVASAAEASHSPISRLEKPAVQRGASTETACTLPASSDHAEPYVMRIADLLSDDPLLIDVLGRSFKVIADYDRKAKRVTYSFRAPDDVGSDEHDAKVI